MSSGLLSSAKYSPLQAVWGAFFDRENIEAAALVKIVQFMPHMGYNNRKYI